jgi:hypothetical protein
VKYSILGETIVRVALVLELSHLLLQLNSIHFSLQHKKMNVSTQRINNKQE